jgi:pyochelin biosynthetic protein PchC
VTDTDRPRTAAPGAPLWLALRPVPARPAHLALLVAHAGAGPSSLRDVAQALPPDWGVFALALPGRERRFAEPPEWELHAVARDAADGVRVLLDSVPGGPVGLTVAGQCSGAWLAYAIVAAGGPAVQSRCTALFAVSGLPWHAPRSGGVLPRESDAMWRQLAAAGNTPPAVAADGELRELLEPSIRADYAAVGRFPADAEPLGCPIVAVGGTYDADVDEEGLSGWSRYTASLRLAWLPSGHLPMLELPERTAKVLAGGSPD